jgi:hypothetical protein
MEIFNKNILFIEFFIKTKENWMNFIESFKISKIFSKKGIRKLEVIFFLRNMIIFKKKLTIVKVFLVLLNRKIYFILK